METIIERIIATTYHICGIGASIIAIYLFLFKRETISSAFKLLINYSKQLTLSDLKSKFERLNDFDANDEKQKVEVINILHEIEGQINGNISLKQEFSEVLKKVNSYTSLKKKITEPIKRSLISELRENLRNLDIQNFNGIINKKQ
jgi:hypothetical protein